MEWADISCILHFVLAQCICDIISLLESEEEEEEITEDSPAVTSENSTAKQTDLNKTPSESQNIPEQTAADQEQTITNTANINDTVEEADDDR